MAAVLFRRLLSKIDDFSNTITPEVQEICKNQLIEAAHKEQDESMRKKISDSIAELAKCYLGIIFYINIVFKKTPDFGLIMLQTSNKKLRI